MTQTDARQWKKNCELEVCVDSVESALAAEEGGADRIELCGNLIIGGTTPSPALFTEIRRCSSIPAHVMIRPRYGDFCYSDYEFEVMKKEVAAFREAGAEGIVIGIMKPDGSLDTERMAELMEQGAGMKVTLHRCFDLCRDPFTALEEAIRLGIDIILTSGQQSDCLEGMELLKELEEKSAGRILIQAGAGVSAEAIRVLFPATGIRAYHLSGKKDFESPVRYRKENVSMGIPSVSEYVITRTDPEKIREAKTVLETVSATETGNPEQGTVR